MPEMLKEALFKSEAQRGWMYDNHPAMAERWQAHTPKGKKLPKHVKKAYPFLIDIKLANLGVTNVGPASNALAGFGQAMLGSAPAAIPKQTNFVPQPSPSVPPILGGPTAGPGTPVSGGAMPKAPSLDTMRSIGRTSTSTSSPTSTDTTTKVADVGSILKPIMNAAQKAVPSVTKAVPKVLPKVEGTVASALPRAGAGSALPYGADAAGRFHMDSSGNVLHPYVGRPLPPSYLPPVKPAPAGSTPPVAPIVHGGGPAAPPVKTPAAPATSAPAPVTPPATAAAPPPPPPPPGGPPSSGLTPPANGGGGFTGFMTAPLNGSAPPPGGVGAVKGTLNAATRVVTPHTTLAEAGTALEKGLNGGKATNTFMPTPGRSWDARGWGEYARDQFKKPTAGGLLNAGAQIVSLPGRAVEGPLRTLMGGNPLGRMAGMPLALGGAAAYSAAAATQDPSRPMASPDYSTLMRPISNLTNTLGITDPNDPKNPAAAGMTSVFDPFGVGGTATKSLATHPQEYGSILGKKTWNAGVSGVQGFANIGNKGFDKDQTHSLDQYKYPEQDIMNDMRSIKGLPAIQQQMGDLDQQIAAATQAGDHATVAKLNAQKQSMQKGMMDHGTAIAQQAQQDPNMQMQGVNNLQKELPEGTPPSFISGLWKIMQSNPWASGLMIAGLGLGALSMMGAFGGHNGIAAIAGLASTLVGAGMMPKEMWTQISSKLFGGQQAAPAPAAAAPPPAQNGVAAPKLAPGQAAAQPQQQVDAFGLNPADKATMLNSPALRPFLGPDGSPNPTAIKNFVMNGDVNAVPGIVAAIPPHARANLAKQLSSQGAGWTTVGKAFIQALNGG